MAEVKSFYDYFKEYAEQRCGDVYLFDERQSYTTFQAFNAASSLAGRLWKEGIRAGDLVALRCTRSQETCLIYFALQFIGAMTVMVDPHEAFDKTVNGIEMRAYITSEFSNDENWTVCLNDRKTELTIPNGRQECRAEFPVYSDLSAPTTVVFTSGSTGKSKAVMLSQMNNIMVSVETEPIGWYRSDDIAMGILPIHHVFGLSLLITSLVAKYAIFFPRSVDIPYLLECIERYKITRMNGVPTLYLAMANANKTEKRNVDTLRTGLIGGAPVTREQFGFIESALGVTMIPVYGMSECIAISCASYKDNADARSQTVGKFYEMSRGSIVDNDGNELLQGKEGEICIQSPVVMVGYLNEKSESVIDERGRLHTGDLGYVDKDGYLHICGRKKDIIIRNGINISCGKIEGAICALDGVDQAVVVGIEHEKYGEVPAAFILLCEGETMTAEEIKDNLKTSLNKIEMPHVLETAHSFPLTSSGKPDKQKIKEILKGLCKA